MNKRYPLSKTEEGIYVSCLTPNDAYNLTNCVNLGSDLNVDRFVQAVKKVFAAHPYLFTVLSEGEDGRVYKEIRPKEIEIPLIQKEDDNFTSPPFKMSGSTCLGLRCI